MKLTRAHDAAQLSVTGANCGQPTIGAVRVVLEPKPGLPTDPDNPRAFIDAFTDIDPLVVINNECGRSAPTHKARMRASFLATAAGAAHASQPDMGEILYEYEG